MTRAVELAAVWISLAAASFASGSAPGGATMTIVPARGRDLAVWGSTRTDAEPARLVAWTRAIDQLYKGRYVPALGRFSSPPRLEDLFELTLGDQDLDDLRSCRPGDCGVKLGAAEIEQIRTAAASAGDDWREAVQRAFRQALVARAQQYLADGLSGAPPYHDRSTIVSPAAEYEAVAALLDVEPAYGARLLPYFERYPHGDAAGVESFLYWSRETLGGGKPIVSITHVAIVRDAYTLSPHTVVAARQVYASHYLTASISFTLLEGRLERPRHLTYVRRLRTDAFEGLFGRFVRSVVERRIRSEGPAALETLRRKLETGNPAGPDSQ